MAWIETLLAALGINKVSVIFGAIGAALHAVRGKDRHPFERVVAFLTGFALAAVGPGFIITRFGLAPDPSYYGALGFVLGYFGMSIMDAAGDAIGALKQVRWKEIVETRLGRKGD